MNKPAKLILSFVICFSVAALGSYFTIPKISTWYVGLNKPVFSPPNQIFGPVWTFLYLNMAISFYLIWSKSFNNKKVREAILLFTTQLILNLAWSFFFFGLESPLLGLVDIVFLWFFVFLTIRNFYKISKNAGLILIPYLVWISFAGVLNLFVYLLN